MGDQLFTKQQYKDARARIISAKSALTQEEALLEAMQRVCAHDMVAGGHSHNDTEYTCSHCGKVEWR